MVGVAGMGDGGGGGGLWVVLGVGVITVMGYSDGGKSEQNFDDENSSNGNDSDDSDDGDDRDYSDWGLPVSYLTSSTFS